MEGQGQLFDPDKLNASQFPVQDGVHKAASRYMEGEGLGQYTPPATDKQVDPQRGFAQYKAYEKAQGEPETPTIRGSYEALRQGVHKQFDYITRPEAEGGMGVTVESKKDDPYGLGWAGGTDTTARQNMETDFNENKRMQVMSTGENPGQSHAYFSDEENDKFRAVHDVFGHIGTGSSFSRNGEEAGFESHKQMFPPEAHEALTSETRGQNSYLNYGNKGFPDQGEKLVGLPAWASETGRLNLPAGSLNKSRTGNRGRQERLFES